MIIRTLATLMVLILFLVSVNAESAANGISDPMAGLVLTIDDLKKEAKNSNPAENIIPSSNSDTKDTITDQKEIIIMRLYTRYGMAIFLSIMSICSLLIVISAIQKMNGSTADLVNASALNFIIFGTLILVTVVETQEQLTAAIGVIGAITGYLLSSLKERVGHTEEKIPLSTIKPKKDDTSNAPIKLEKQ